MKITILLFLCLSGLAFGQNETYFSENHEFTTNDIVFLFGDKVKLRNAPSTDAEVVGLLKIGSQLTILRKTDQKTSYAGIAHPWYRVDFQGREGYILGGLLALDKIDIQNTSYLIAFKKEENSTFLNIRLLEDGKPYQERQELLATTQFSLKAFDNQGLQEVKSMLHVDYLSEACGVDGGGIYIFYDGNQLIKGLDYTQISDAGVYWYHEEFLFPNQEGGQKGKIVYKRETGEYVDEETNWITSTKMERELEWKDNRLFPELEKMEQ